MNVYRIPPLEQNFGERNLERSNLAQGHHVKVGGTNSYLDAQKITSLAGHKYSDN